MNNIKLKNGRTGFYDYLFAVFVFAANGRIIIHLTDDNKKYTISLYILYGKVFLV